MSDDLPGEEQSQFHTGLDLPKYLHQLTIRASMCSHMTSMQGMKEWLFFLQDIEREVYPRLKSKDHRTLLDNVRVSQLPSPSRATEYQTVMIIRAKLDKYQQMLTFLRDKLGLGFKAGDDPSKAILK